MFKLICKSSHYQPQNFVIQTMHTYINDYAKKADRCGVYYSIPLSLSYTHIIFTIQTYMYKIIHTTGVATTLRGKMQRIFAFKKNLIHFYLSAKEILTLLTSCYG